MGGSGSGSLRSWEEREARRDEERRLLVEDVMRRVPRAKELLEAAGCSEAWIVGSVARGEPDGVSDVDVVVMGLDAGRRPGLWWDLCELFGREVDLAEMERIPPGRLEALIADGTRILP